jgi:hypothetical protein
VADNLWDRIRKAGKSLTRMLRNSAKRQRNDTRKTESKKQVTARAQQRALDRKKRLGHFKDVAPALDVSSRKPIKNPPSEEGNKPPDFTDKFNTILPQNEENDFQKWSTDNNRQGDTYDYDLRGAWKAGNRSDDRGHFPDTWKKPNHPTFSDESIYSKPGQIGGHWGKEDNKDTFTPSETNRRMYGQKGLEDYFRKREPEAKLLDEPERTPQEQIQQGAELDRYERRERLGLPQKSQRFEFHGKDSSTKDWPKEEKQPESKPQLPSGQPKPRPQPLPEQPEPEPQPQPERPKRTDETTGDREPKGFDAQQPGGGTGATDNSDKLLAEIKQLLAEQTQNLVDRLTEVIKQNSGYGP